MASIYGQCAIRSRGLCTVTRERFAPFPADNESSGIEVIAAFAHVTVGNAARSELQGLAFKRENIGVEAVGTLQIVGIKGWRIVQITITNDETIVDSVCAVCRGR